MSFFNKNKNILLRHYPGLLEEITLKSDDELSPEDITIETLPAGPALNIKGLHVHSTRDPLREGQRLAESITGDGPVVILGFGLGYAAQAAAAAGKQIIVVEKYRSLILKALELRDFSDFLSRNRIMFVIGGCGEGITDALAIASRGSAGKTGGADKHPSIIRNRALVSLDEQWYRTAEDRIRTWTIRDDVNTATHKRFGKRWVRNLSRNMTAIRDYPGVSRLCGIASGSLPVFLAAAGPSLDKIKPLLCDIYDRCIIVAVDTSLRFFVKNAIQPDFVLVVDPQFWNSRHLDRCFCAAGGGQTALRTALVAESAVYPPVLNLPFKNIFLCGSLFPLGDFIEKQVDPKGRLGAGGSVATTAWDFARSLGAREIWTAGLDLAFPQQKTHFRGARFEECSNAQSNRFNSGEKWVMRALRDGKPFRARSKDGGQVLTDQRLSLYAAWFENQFRSNAHVRTFSLCRDGLAIEGLHVKEFQEFLALPPQRGEIDRRIGEVFAQTENEFNDLQEKQKRAERYDKAVYILKRGLFNIKTAAEEGKEIARRALRYPMNSSQQKRVLAELDEVTRRITESEVKDVAGFLFTPEFAANLPAGKNGEEDSFRSFLKSSLSLFSGVADTAETIAGI